MKHKEPFKLIRKWTERDSRFVEYEASFWEGPLEAGREGRYVRSRCVDQVLDGRCLNTAPSVSYYGDLRKACKGWLL